MQIKIFPSLLAADFGRLNDDIATIESFVDGIHFDVMDGHFVPNLTVGAPVLKCLKTKLPIDAHLMVTNPDGLIEDFAEAGAKMLSVHIEGRDAKSCVSTLQKIKQAKMRAGVALNPETPLKSIAEIMDKVDYVLLMTVNPGFGGQGFIRNVLPKIRELRALKPKLDIQVDGGINAETAKLAREAGANILVAGTYIFSAPDRKIAIQSLRM